MKVLFDDRRFNLELVANCCLIVASVVLSSQAAKIADTNLKPVLGGRTSTLREVLRLYERHTQDKALARIID